jgi:hypothetical protein
MKKIFIYIPILLSLFIAACSSDDGQEINPRAEKIKLLTSSVWTTESVMHSTDGDLTFQYETFSISFTNNASAGVDGDYVVANGGVAFPQNNGKWSLSTDMANITLTSGEELLVESLTDGSLKLKVVVAPASGRMKGLSGEFTFLLKH